MFVLLKSSLSCLFLGNKWRGKCLVEELKITTTITLLLLINQKWSFWSQWLDSWVSEHCPYQVLLIFRSAPIPYPHFQCGRSWKWPRNGLSGLSQNISGLYKPDLPHWVSEHCPSSPPSLAIWTKSLLFYSNIYKKSKRKITEKWKYFGH